MTISVTGFLSEDQAKRMSAVHSEHNSNPSSPHLGIASEAFMEEKKIKKKSFLILKIQVIVLKFKGLRRMQQIPTCPCPWWGSGSLRLGDKRAG